MNRVRVTTAAMVLLMLSSLCGWAIAGIEGSKHDFSNRDWSGGNQCGACHSPHSATPPTAAPLWNADADLKRTFGVAIGEKPSPGSGTKMCIRCHDGTIARDTIAGAVKGRFVNKQNPGMFGSGHDRSDHPVGVRFPVVDRGFRPLASIEARGDVMLPEGKVECVSCHDPHNQAGHDSMLVMSNARSALCLTCHRK